MDRARFIKELERVDLILPEDEKRALEAFDAALASASQADATAPTYIYKCLVCSDRKENISLEEAKHLCREHTNKTRVYANAGFSGHATSFKARTFSFPKGSLLSADICKLPRDGTMSVRVPQTEVRRDYYRNGLGVRSLETTN